MTKKLQLILDAVSIIDANKFGFWNLLVNNCDIGIAATVFEDEIYYFEGKSGAEPLIPTQWLQKGLVQRLEADPKDYEILRSKLSQDVMLGIDDGELESLALLFSPKSKGFLFSTADRAAVKALGLLGLKDRGMSTEVVLENIGAPKSTIKKLPSHHTQKWFMQRLDEGFMERITIF